MKENFNSIDLFKFLMAMVVVAFHTNPFVDCKSVLVNEIVMLIADLSVPFFFIASGYFLALRWGDTSHQRERYIYKTFISAFRLYAMWTLLSLPLTIYGYVISGESIVHCVFSYIKYFFFVGKLYNSYHLWYLLAMVYALMAMWILIHYGKNTRHILLAGVFFYIVYLAFAWIRQSDSAGGLLSAIGSAFDFVFNKGGVFVGMLYMSVGILFREHRRMKPLVSMAGIAVSILVRYQLSQELGNILCSVMLFAVILNMKLSDHPCYFTLRRLSKYIYLSHLICFSVYTFVIIDQPNKLGVDSFLVTFFMSAVIAAVIIYVNGLLKIVRKGA